LITQADDKDDVKVEYWAVDNVGNVEGSHTFYIDMDQTPPNIDFLFEDPGPNWMVILIFTTDSTGMERLEIYFNDELKEIIYNPPSIYTWEFEYPPDENIIFKAVAYDRAGNRAEKSINLKEKFDFNIQSRDKQEDCDCQEVVSDVELNRIKKTIDKFEVYTNLLSLYSKKYSEIIEEYEYINNQLSSIQENYYPMCFVYLILFIRGEVWDEITTPIYEYNTILYWLLYPILFSRFALMGIAYKYAVNAECWWVDDISQDIENFLKNPFNNIIN
jgi:hypothetical protein